MLLKIQHKIAHNVKVKEVCFKSLNLIKIKNEIKKSHVHRHS